MRRRVHRRGDFRPLEPAHRHAARGGGDQLFHAADPAGAERRAADHHSPVDRSGDRLCRLGAVSDRRRADAGAAPAHLWRNLRDDAGQLVYLGAAGRISRRRQPERFPAAGSAGHARAVRRTGAGLSADPGESALVSAQGQSRGSGRHRQPDHQPVRQSRGAADGRSARRRTSQRRANSCRRSRHSFARVSCAGPSSAL